MITYLLIALSVISALTCLYLVKSRNVKAILVPFWVTAYLMIGLVYFINQGYAYKINPQSTIKDFKILFYNNERDLFYFYGLESDTGEYRLIAMYLSEEEKKRLQKEESQGTQSGTPGHIILRRNDDSNVEGEFEFRPNPRFKKDK